MNIDVGRGNIEENVDKFQLKAEIMFCAVSHNLVIWLMTSRKWFAMDYQYAFHPSQYTYCS